MWRRLLAAGAMSVLAGFVTAGAAQADERRCQGPHGESTTTTTVQGISTFTEGSPRQEVVVWDVRRLDGVRISCDGSADPLTAAAATTRSTDRKAARSTSRAATQTATQDTARSTRQTARPNTAHNTAHGTTHNTAQSTAQSTRQAASPAQSARSSTRQSVTAGTSGTAATLEAEASLG